MKPILTLPQEKLLRIIRRCNGKRFKLHRGEWVVGRSLKQKGLITETSPRPMLTAKGVEIVEGWEALFSKGAFTSTNGL